MMGADHDQRWAYEGGGPRAAGVLRRKAQAVPHGRGLRTSPPLHATVAMGAGAGVPTATACALTALQVPGTYP